MTDYLKFGGELSCRDCVFYEKTDYECNNMPNGYFAKCNKGQDIYYCSTERMFTKRLCSSSCGQDAKHFEPNEAYKIKYMTSDEYLFRQNPLAFWLDPKRWDGGGNMRDPNIEPFWMRV